MTDYKNTLNLPVTDFPMKANLAQREPEVLKHWNSINLYQQLQQQWKNRPKFILHDGPPYANGAIHLGHAVNKVLKDIVVKSKIMSGYATPYVPGWDCHGLPIELNVEKKLGKVGVKVSRAEFLKACREFPRKFIDVQREEFKRLGVIGDWQHPYITMDFRYEANIIRSFAKVLSNGNVSQGFKPVYWCIDCGSALAAAEVEYENKTSPSIDVRFNVVDEAQFLKCFNELTETGQGKISVPIWTTTPWTLPANEAVALNTNINYVLVQAGDKRLLLAEPLMLDTLKRYQIEDAKILGRAVGKVFEKLLLQHPFYDKQVPIILGEHVTIDAGTGAVHTAPAHGQEDFAVAYNYHLPLNNPVGGNGCYLPETPIFAGEHVFKANDHVIEVLREKNALLAFEKIEHSYPHCWRHKTPLIFRATPQWFINLDKLDLRQRALQAIKKVKWYPPQGEARITAMVENNPDWCISRQRTWGVPIAVFLHKEDSKPHPRTLQLIEEIAKRVEQKGIEAWYELDIKELLGDEAKDYVKSHDVLDVWFDSGVTHYCVLSQNPELHFPADLYLEGSDQHRGWFQSSLLTSIALENQAPYKGVLTHGFTVDSQGRKMSKSLGNGIAPEEVIKSLGADILRLWIASTDYRNEIAGSEEILKRTADAYRRIRNTARFLLANLHDFDPEKDLIKFDDMLALDRWAVFSAQTLQQEVVEAYEQYQFHLIYQKAHNFCALEMGGFYLDIIKDRQYTLPKNSKARRSAQSAMFHIVQALTRWLAPILSFTAEEIWRYIPGKHADSVLFTGWYENFANMKLDAAMDQEFWKVIMQVRGAVNKELERLRALNEIGAGLEADVSLYCEESLYRELTKLKDELRFILITSRADIFSIEKADPNSVTTEMTGLKLLVKPSPNTKCVRCWHRREDVGTQQEHPELCGRCVENISSPEGETRCYA